MLRGLQRLGRWMFCLALIAQIGGVVPLVYVDTVHEYERSGDAVELADDRVVALVSIARVDEHPVRIDRPPRA